MQTKGAPSSVRAATCVRPQPRPTPRRRGSSRGLPNKGAVQRPRVGGPQAPPGSLHRPPHLVQTTRLSARCGRQCAPRPTGGATDGRCRLVFVACATIISILPARWTGAEAASHPGTRSAALKTPRTRHGHLQPDEPIELGSVPPTRPASAVHAVTPRLFNRRPAPDVTLSGTTPRGKLKLDRSVSASPRANVAPIFDDARQTPQVVTFDGGRPDLQAGLLRRVSAAELVKRNRLARPLCSFSSQWSHCSGGPAPFRAVVFGKAVGRDSDGG